MSRENFTVEIKNVPVKTINRAEWTGRGRIPEVTSCLAPTGRLAVTIPLDFRGYIALKGNLEQFQKDGNEWIYRWSQAAKQGLCGQATLTLKHDDNTIADVVVAVTMSRVSDIIIKRPPFLTVDQIFATVAVGFVAGLLCLPFWVR